MVAGLCIGIVLLAINLRSTGTSPDGGVKNLGHGKLGESSDFGGGFAALACIAHGFGKRGLTLSEPVSRDVELSWVEGQTPFSETVRNAG